MILLQFIIFHVLISRNSCHGFGSIPCFCKLLDIILYYVKFVCEIYIFCFSFKDIYDLYLQNIHCLLNVNPLAIERLQRQQIYPIVVYARHKSYKQLRYIMLFFVYINMSLLSSDTNSDA